MKKSEYLDKLYYEIGNMKAEQKEEIISIFVEHFEQGALDGKSEEDICNDLGSPASVAAQFLENNRDRIQEAPGARKYYEPEQQSRTERQIRPERGDELDYNRRSDQRGGFNLDSIRDGLTRNEENNRYNDNRYNERQKNSISSGYDERPLLKGISINKKFSAERIDRINISMSCSDIKVMPYTGNELTVVITGQSKNSRFDVYVDNGILNVLEERKFVLVNLFNLNRTVQTEVYVPREFHGTVFLKNKAGNIQMGAVDIQHTEIHATAGDIRVEGYAGILELKSTAGNTRLYNVRGNKDLISTAGDITIENCDGDLKIYSTAGNVKIANNNGYISSSTTAGNTSITGNEVYGMNASSSAGNVKVEAARIAGDVTVSSAVGNVKLEAREVAGSITAKTNMGNTTIILPRDVSMNIVTRSIGKIRSSITSDPQSPYTLDVIASFGDVNIKAMG